MALVGAADGIEHSDTTAPVSHDEPSPTETLAEPERQSDPSEAIVTSSTFQILGQHVLQFLINADNETLGACGIGLCAVIYIVFGRIGLIFIGMVGGVLLHASWERAIGSVTDDNVEKEEYNRRREVGFDVAARVLGWRLNHGSAGGDDQDGEMDRLNALSFSQKQQTFVGFQPATREALSRLVDAVIRDYIR